MEIIRARYPYHDILAEESVGTKTGPRRRAAAEGRPYTWLVDPLDGTAN